MKNKMDSFYNRSKRNNTRLGIEKIKSVSPAPDTRMLSNEDVSFYLLFHLINQINSSLQQLKPG